MIHELVIALIAETVVALISLLNPGPNHNLVAYAAKGRVCVNNLHQNRALNVATFHV